MMVGKDESTCFFSAVGVGWNFTVFASLLVIG